MNRRQLLMAMPAFLRKRRPRTSVFMIDGLGPEYIGASRMPVL